MPQIEEMQAADTAKMQNPLASIGAVNPSAGMVSLGQLDLSTPDMTSPFVSTYRVRQQKEREIVVEEASQSSGLLTDPNQFTPTPEAGMLRMS